MKNLDKQSKTVYNRIGREKNLSDPIQSINIMITEKITSRTILAAIKKAVESEVYSAEYNSEGYVNAHCIDGVHTIHRKWIKVELESARTNKIQSVLSDSLIEKINSLPTYRVQRKAGNKEYIVGIWEKEWYCSCPDFKRHCKEFGAKCKHIMAVQAVDSNTYKAESA